MSETVRFKPHLAMNDYTGLAAALLASCGIGNLSPIRAPDLVREGRLIEVMPTWRFQVRDLWLVHVDVRHVARAVRLFIDFAAERAPSLFPDLPK